jgi:hypothetical protein
MNMPLWDMSWDTARSGGFRWEKGPTSLVEAGRDGDSAKRENKEINAAAKAHQGAYCPFVVFLRKFRRRGYLRFGLRLNDTGHWPMKNDISRRELQMLIPWPEPLTLSGGEIAAFVSLAVGAKDAVSTC